MNEHGAEFVEIFLQEASEHLQFLREYCGILQDAYPQAADVERLALASAKVQDQLGGQPPARVVSRPPKLVNLVTARSAK